MIWHSSRSFSPGGEMADARDLKSLDRKVVRVRLPPRAPIPFPTNNHGSFLKTHHVACHPGATTRRCQKHGTLKLFGLSEKQYPALCHLEMDPGKNAGRYHQVPSAEHFRNRSCPGPNLDGDLDALVHSESRWNIEHTGLVLLAGRRKSS